MTATPVSDIDAVLSTQKSCPRGIHAVPYWAGLTMLVVVLFVCAVAFGSVRIPVGQVLTVLFGGAPSQHSWETIVRDVRIPQAITAALTGAALSVSGLQMQTLFRNALADPYILGVSSGASLGVAIVVLLAGSSTTALLSGLGMLGAAGVSVAAAGGACLVLVIVLAVARRVRSNVTVLVVGLMVGYISSAVVSVLVFTANESAIRNYLIWTFGSFTGVTWTQIKVFAPLVAAAVCFVLLTTKALNAFLLGERYASSMGMNVPRMRTATITSAAILAGVVTAFVGPIAFVGIAVPHLARGLFRTADHKVLVPAVVLLGACITLVATIVSYLPGGGTALPISAVTSLIGAPIVIWVLVRAKGSQVGSL